MKTQNPSNQSFANCIVHATERKLRRKKTKKNEHTKIFNGDYTTQTIPASEERITSVQINDGRIFANGGNRSFSIPSSGMGQRYYSESQGNVFRRVCEGGEFTASVHRLEGRKNVVQARLSLDKVKGENPGSREAYCLRDIDVPAEVTDLCTCLDYDNDSGLIVWGTPGWIQIINPMDVGWVVQKKINIGALVPTAITYSQKVMVFACTDGNIYVYDYHANSTQFIRSLADEFSPKESK